MREMGVINEREVIVFQEMQSRELIELEMRIKSEDEKHIEKLKKTVEDLTKEMENDEGVEEARRHLECPVCLEMMRPPKRIWMCHKSHLVCEECRFQLANNICPTCRTERVTGRAFFAENMARALLCDQ